MKPYVLIGGPADGRRISVPDAFYGQWRVAAIPNRAYGSPSVPVIQVEAHDYTLWEGDAGDPGDGACLGIGVHSSLCLVDAQRLLLLRYPSEKVREVPDAEG